MKVLALFLNLPFAFFWLGCIVAFTGWLGSFVNAFSALTWLGLGFAYSAWILMAIAKWPQIRKLDLFTFGSQGLPIFNKRLYRLSYFVMLLGACLILSSHFTDVLSFK